MKKYKLKKGKKGAKEKGTKPYKGPEVAMKPAKFKKPGGGIF